MKRRVVDSRKVPLTRRPVVRKLPPYRSLPDCAPLLEGPNNSVNSLRPSLAHPGSFYALGAFTIWNSTPAKGFLRVFSDGTVDSDFQPPPDLDFTWNYEDSPIHFAEEPKTGELFACQTVSAASDFEELNVLHLDGTGRILQNMNFGVKDFPPNSFDTPYISISCTGIVRAGGKTFFALKSLVDPADKSYKWGIVSLEGDKTLKIAGYFQNFAQIVSSPLSSWIYIKTTDLKVFRMDSTSGRLDPNFQLPGASVNLPLRLLSQGRQIKILHGLSVFSEEGILLFTLAPPADIKSSHPGEQTPIPYAATSGPDGNAYPMTPEIFLPTAISPPTMGPRVSGEYGLLPTGIRSP